MKRTIWAGLLLTLLLAITADAAKFGFSLADADGAALSGQPIQIKISGTSTVVASTGWGTVMDNGDGTYITTVDLPTAAYSVYQGGGSGTLVPALAAVSHIDPADVTGVRPVAQGGTGGSTASAARTNLGLAIGTNVQAYNQYLTDWTSFLNYIWGSVGTNVFPYWVPGGGSWQYATASQFRTAVGLGIGSNVQAYDADLTTLGAGGSGARSFLGLGGVATYETTGTGEANKVPVITLNNSLGLPRTDTAITPGSTTVGQFYVLETGNASTGTCTLNVIVRKGNGLGAWTYESIEVVKRTW